MKVLSFLSYGNKFSGACLDYLPAFDFVPMSSRPLDHFAIAKTVLAADDALAVFGLRYGTEVQLHNRPDRVLDVAPLVSVCHQSFVVVGADGATFLRRVFTAEFGGFSVDICERKESVTDFAVVDGYWKNVIS